MSYRNVLVIGLFFASLPMWAQGSDTLDNSMDGLNYWARIALTKRHFPPGVFDSRDQGSDDFVASWYDKQLDALGESGTPSGVHADQASGIITPERPIQSQKKKNDAVSRRI